MLEIIDDAFRSSIINPSIIEQTMLDMWQAANDAVMESMQIEAWTQGGPDATIRGLCGSSDEVTRHNMALHTEPFLGRVSVSCFLYGPGERYRYLRSSTGSTLIMRNSHQYSRSAFHTLVAILLTTLFVGDAKGQTQSFEFTGTVDNLSQSLSDIFSLGDSVTGSYSVDAHTFAASDLLVTIGDDYTLTAESGRVSLVPGVWFNVAFSSGIQGPPVDGISPSFFDIQLNDPNNILIPGTLPLSYSIGEFGRDRSNINFMDDSRRLDFRVDSITAVPEPSSLQFLLISMLTLAQCRRRNGRSR